MGVEGHDAAFTRAVMLRTTLEEVLALADLAETEEPSIHDRQLKEKPSYSSATSTSSGVSVVLVHTWADGPENMPRLVGGGRLVPGRSAR